MTAMQELVGHHCLTNRCIVSVVIGFNTAVSVIIIQNPLLGRPTPLL